MAVDEVRRTVRDIRRKMEDAAARLHGLAFPQNSPGYIFPGILVIRSLDVEIRPKKTDGLFGGRRPIDRDVIDRLQIRQAFGSDIFRKRRSKRSLVDEFVRGQRHDEDIAQGARLVEMTDVTDVKQVEDTVTLDDLPPFHSSRIQDGLQEFEGDDFIPGFIVRPGHDSIAVRAGWAWGERCRNQDSVAWEMDASSQTGALRQSSICSSMIRTPS